MSDHSTVVSALASLAQECAWARQRRLVVLAGETAWGRTTAEGIVHALPGKWCWIGKTSEVNDTIAMEKVHTLLGGEWQGLVYDARAGFDADAFGAVAGTLQAGGLLLLLTPHLAEWPDYPDPQRARITVYPYAEDEVGGRFLQRFVSLLRDSDDSYLIEQDRALAPLPLLSQPPASAAEYGECATADQLAAVEALCKVAQGHRRRPLVLVSDRGRGKSAALGLAAARLLQQGIKRIVVTAPRLAAVEQLFFHAAAQSGEAEQGRGHLKLPEGGELLFVPPDRLLQEEIACDLLLVDEAAAIPVSLLEPLLRRHARIAFATTVHGYEGTGRGFDLRFRRVLDEVTPEWRRLRMEQPIRWAEGDALERLVFRVLLLDAEPAADEVVASMPLDECTIERQSRDDLLENEVLLSQLFGLLVLAHYRTSPADLRNLLDGPNLELYLMRHGETLLACALVAKEGGFDEELAVAVYEGRRRLRGNLLPQSLASHGGLREAPLLRAARVMRIAVHPACQGRGVGRRLIDALAQQVAVDGCDYLGASFGADTRLLDFWLQCDCVPVRVGLKREASSGAHAVMVVRSLSERGVRFVAQAKRRFSRHFVAQLSEPLAELESGLVVRLLRHTELLMATELGWQDAADFATTSREYGNCQAGLIEVLLQVLSADESGLSEEKLQLAVMKVLQRRPWGEVVMRLQLAGRGEAITRLRDLYRILCAQMG